MFFAGRPTLAEYFLPALVYLLNYIDDYSSYDLLVYLIKCIFHRFTIVIFFDWIPDFTKMSWWNDDHLCRSQNNFLVVFSNESIGSQFHPGHIRSLIQYMNVMVGWNTKNGPFMIWSFVRRHIEDYNYRYWCNSLYSTPKVNITGLGQLLVTSRMWWNTKHYIATYSVAKVLCLW